VQRATSATKALKSFHFRLSHENGGTPMLLGLELTSAEGDVGVPDKLAADVRAKAAGVNVSVKVVGIEHSVADAATTIHVSSPIPNEWLTPTPTVALTTMVPPPGAVRVTSAPG